MPILQRAVMSCRASVGALPYEFVVCDGGSTDGSREWLAAQPDVVLVGKRSLDGAVDAFNHCFDVSRGEFVATLNDDMNVVAHALAEGVQHLQEHAECGQVAFAFRGPTEDWHVNHVYPDAMWSTVYANFGIARRIAMEAVRYITGGMWAPIYYTYAGDCELSAWLHRLGWTIEVRNDLRVEDIRTTDGLRARNEQGADFEASLFYWRWPCEAFRAVGITPNVSSEELRRYREVIDGRWVSPSKVSAEELQRHRKSLAYVASVRMPWPCPDREPALAAVAPQLHALDPVHDQLPQRAASLRRSERVVHFHLGTETDPQAGLVRAIRSLAVDESVYRKVDWVSHPDYEEKTLVCCAEVRPTLVFMQIQTPDVVSPEMIRRLREASDPRVVVITWNGDVGSNNSPWSIDWQVPLGRAVDLTLHSSMTHVRALRAAGVHNAAYLQIGYDPDQYRLPPERTIREHDVCFLGSRYYGDEFSRSLRAHDGDLRDEVITAMRSAFGVRFALYGTGYGADVQPIPLSRSHEALWMSKLALSISLSNDFEFYSSDRLPRALACGGAVLLKRFSGMGSWGLRHGENCLAWESVEEAVTLAGEAVATGAWEHLGVAGAALASAHHTWNVRMLELQPYLDAVRASR